MKNSQGITMKWQVLYFCLFLLFISIFSACRADSSINLVGTWSTSDGGLTIAAC